MANMIKKALSGLIETMLDKGHVVAVRTWQPGTMVEVDLHLPDIDLSQWLNVKRLKIKVAALEYRDYTPATWNAAKRICTMYIEAEHDGAGSTWAKSLKKGDEVLFGPAYAGSTPTETGKILCLGDGSALGHFLAIKQLTNRKLYPFSAVVFLANEYELPAKFVRDNPELDCITKKHGNALDELSQWVQQRDLSQYTTIYMYGQASLVKGMKNLLRDKDEVQARIYSAAFWR